MTVISGMETWFNIRNTVSVIHYIIDFKEKISVRFPLYESQHKICLKKKRP